MSTHHTGLLSLGGVRKTYGSAVAVESVSLDVAQGEFVSFLGPSGSGKTTTLQMIAGFIRPDIGTVTLAGRDLTKVPPFRRNIGMVFQHYALFPHLTVANNVAFPLKMRKTPAEETRRRVERALEQVHLTALADRKPAQLSGGQQQRVALARAFVFEPGLLLMDEPLGALDKKLRETLQTEISRLTKELGVSVVYVTHDQDEALAMSDRIAIYNGGRIEQLGTGRDLYERPRTLFVATFMGDSTVFHGRYEAGTSEAVLKTAAGPFVVPSTSAIATGDAAALVVRPERMRIASQESPSTANRVLGTVRDVVYLGAQQRVLVDVPDAGEVMVKQPGATADPELRPGHPVCLTWLPEDSVVVADPAPAVEPAQA
ncbi:ABC transporter ATP-binding protein [Pseudonocardia sp. CA-107938]|uniref:ABC transporter ATP-binding protein n=1 Tax=Pseudonocardia sp. CA-107938 TaxID=3240021 RepID=UPI003D920028